VTAMFTRNRWKEMLLSLAAGQQMVPFGDNRAVLRNLSQQIWALRAAEAQRKAVARTTQLRRSHADERRG
jgi:hypothetical protein